MSYFRPMNAAPLWGLCAVLVVLWVPNDALAVVTAGTNDLENALIAVQTLITGNVAKIIGLIGFVLAVVGIVLGSQQGFDRTLVTMTGAGGTAALVVGAVSVFTTITGVSSLLPAPLVG